VLSSLETSDGLHAVGALVCAGGLSLILVPVAARVAARTGFLDRPADYKKHASPTPYLGGVAVLVAFTLAAAIFGGAFGPLLWVTLPALGLMVLGAVDDRIGLGPGIRFLAHVGAALILWADGIRWEVTGIAALDLAITIVWVVGLANAFNLLDNIDGSTGTVAAVSAAGIGVLALINDAGIVAGFCFALTGACLGFLRFNLARPSRIFLGDAGSVPIGFLLAAMTMIVPLGIGSGESLLAVVPFVGVAIFDTALVVVSRTRLGKPILSGGRDHFTHRMLLLFGSPQAVALVLVLIQGSLCLLAIMLQQSPSSVIDAVAAFYVVGAIVALALIERAPVFRPALETPN
jgi:UDP-GlcNAc:undecaprenyl-phosphate GlcNAc-1-phosphate transferase